MTNGRHNRNMHIQFNNVGLTGSNAIARFVIFKYAYDPAVPFCLYDSECGETIGNPF